MYGKHFHEFHTRPLDDNDMHFVCCSDNSKVFVSCYDGVYMHNGARMLTGLFCIIPCTDSIVKIDLRTVSFDIPPQEVSFFARGCVVLM